ncbi:hypothetical protein [Endozoicomonas acroporae]|uniref:hypothetical protein n=1 Tax=Endozoicomonas acroporae TaxID=1701104 RepID=UPI0013D1A903|nr:hypothetical protein [Endozoicomonas acroporae]
MPPLASSNAQPIPLPPSEPEVSEAAIATAFNSNVQITASSSRQLPDSVEHPEHSLDEQQITAVKPGGVKTELGKSPTKFQENDILLIYPQDFSDHSSVDLHVNPGKLKDALRWHIHGILDDRYESFQIEDEPTREEEQSLADSIITRLPAALYEFLNKDWSGRDWFVPEEYQALAKFHFAFIFFNEDDLLNYEICEEQGWEYPSYGYEKCGEFKKFLIKECLPLLKGWSEDEVRYIKEWLNYELKRCQKYPDHDRLKSYVDYCHYGPLKADCVSICDRSYRIHENRAAYNRIKNLESQLEKLS